jgi:hypothetical protein
VDLNKPDAGYMQVSQQPLLDTAASLDGYIRASPPQPSPPPH